MEKENTKNNSFSSSIQAHKCKTSTKSLFYPKRNEDKLKITAKLNLYHQRDKRNKDCFCRSYHTENVKFIHSEIFSG
jgi:hypothetical protein